MDLYFFLIVKLCKILYENVALGMYCFVCLLTFKSGFMASGSGFRIQEEGYQSFSNDQAIDPWLQRIVKNALHYRHSTMYLQTAMSQCANVHSGGGRRGMVCDQRGYPV